MKIITPVFLSLITVMSSVHAVDVDGDGSSADEELIAGTSDNDATQRPSWHKTFVGDESDDYFGSAVSGAGDVNGDGYADFIVGAKEDKDGDASEKGYARVFSGIDNSVLYTFEGDNQADHFGYAVSSAGDVNNDGYADIIVGAPLSDMNGVDSGLARVFSGVDGSILYTLSGYSGDDRFGFSVSELGDINNDNYDDFIVSAPQDDNNGSDSGSAFAYSGIDGSLIYTFDGDGAGDYFGHAVSEAGDVNADGYPDLVVGAWSEDYNGGDSGAIRVFSGFDGSQLYVFYGDVANSFLGAAVSGAGDVNNDGYDDIIAGAYGAQSVLVFSGMDGSRLHRFYGDNNYHRFGFAVAGVGDINGDGYADIATSNYREWYSPFGSGEKGVVYIFCGLDGSILHEFYGDSEGSEYENDELGYALGAAGDVDNDGNPDLLVGTRSSPAGNYARLYLAAELANDNDSDYLVNSADLDDENDGLPDSWEIANGLDPAKRDAANDTDNDGLDNTTEYQLGTDPLVVTDTDSDGILDSYEIEEGTDRLDSDNRPVWTYLFKGNSSQSYLGRAVSAAGDVNGDGYGDVIVGVYEDDTVAPNAGEVRVYSGYDGSLLHNFFGANTGDSMGYDVSAAGDVNLDGYDDVIVGAYWVDEVDGEAYVYSGKDGAVLYTFSAINVNQFYGRTVSGGGDVNNDGYPDLIVGWDDNTNGTNSGAIEVYSGQNGSVLHTFYGDTANDFFGRAVANAGDVNNDNYDDIVVGAYGDELIGNERGSVTIFSGVDGSELYKFYGDSNWDVLGISVAAAGDINNDGYADIVAGAYFNDPNGNDSGSAYVYSGLDGSVLYTFDGDSANDYFGQSVRGVGDVNGDGYDDVLVGATLDGPETSDSTGSVSLYSGADGTLLLRLYGGSDDIRFGYDVSGAGDVDGDGYNDLFVGAMHDSRNGSRSGSAFIYRWADILNDPDADTLLNASDTDDDNDGMPDTWEITYGLNPVVNDAMEDPDGDGVDNLTEYTQGTNPVVAEGSTDYDLNADGDGDLVFQDGSGNVTVWQLENAGKDSSAWLGTLATSSVAVICDVDKDLDADLVFQNVSTGDVTLWIIENGLRDSASYIGTQSGYVLSFCGDIDGDGDSDLIYGDASGNIIVWVMENAARQSSAWLGVWAGQSIAAVADVDSDGDEDLVTQDASGNVNVIEMENGNKVAARWIGVWPGRTVVGAGDADNDGDDDIFMESTSPSGDVMVIEMENGLKVTGRWLGVWSGTEVLAVGDIDNDGDADLIQQNSGTGSVQVVEIENGAKVAGRWLGTFAYTVKGVVDADADGDMDVVLQDGSGNVALIELENGSKVGGAKWLGVSSGEVKLFD